MGVLYAKEEKSEKCADAHLNVGGAPAPAANVTTCSSKPSSAAVDPARYSKTVPVGAPSAGALTAASKQLGREPTGERENQLRGNRRISNAKLLATGFQLRYPTFREGYCEALLQYR